MSYLGLLLKSMDRGAEAGFGIKRPAYPPDMVDAVVDICDACELGKHDPPARLVMYYTMVMTLFFDSGYSEVWNKLLTGLAWARTFRLRRENRMQPSPAAISKARVRLGWEPLAELLGMSMVPAHSGPAEVLWAYWRGLRKLARRIHRERAGRQG